MMSKFLRCILYAFPLDLALEFHMLCGYVGIGAGVLHTACHVINFGYKADLVWDTFGIGIWVTGVSLLFMMAFIVTSVQLRKLHHEIFWYTHQLWAPFLVCCVFH